MKPDFESLLAVLGLQTATGIVTGNWLAGAFGAIGLFAGIMLSRAPMKIRQLIVPAVCALGLAHYGPRLFA